MTLMFLGSDALIPHANPSRLKNFGAKLDLPEEFLDTALAQNAPVIPADSPEAKAFTDEELKAYSTTALHSRAPQDFLDKKHAALVALHDFRESRLNPQPPKQEVPTHG